jgi:hypothetical protein
MNKMTSMQPNNLNTSIEITNQDKPEVDTWAIKTFVAAGVIGACAGLLSAYLLVNNKNKTGVKPTVSVREGFRIAVLLVGVIRNVANLWE